MQEYLTVRESFRYEKVIEKSKFIANIRHIQTEEDGRAFLQKIAKEHPFATHNCFAMIADRQGQVQRFSDDGEPHGTAGLPMLEVLKNKKVYQVVAVVTRYFGGIKLGAGGLVRAYASTVAEALTEDKLCKCIQSQIVDLQVGYDTLGILKTSLQRQNCSIIDILYQDTITVQVAMPYIEYEKILIEFKNLLLGKLNYTLKAVEYIPYNQNKEI